MKFKDAFSLRIPKELIALREEYKNNGVPCLLPETLNLLTVVISSAAPDDILEIGTAVGISGTAMLSVCNNAFLDTIEKDENSFLNAKELFAKFAVSDRVKQYLADAGDVINFSDKKYDFIFLDGSKARYYDYIFDLKRHLKTGGTIFADNVLFRGYVDGGVKFGRRDNTIVRNMRDFLTDFLSDESFACTVLETGDGVMIATKLK